MHLNLIRHKSFSFGDAVLAFDRRLVAFTAVAAIAVTAAAFAWLALLAFVLAFRAQLNFGRRHRSQQAFRVAQTGHNSWMGRVETVSLRAVNRCGDAVGALATAVVTASIATLASAFARRFLATCFRTGFWAAAFVACALLAALALTAWLLCGPFLTRRRSIAAHCGGHSCLIGECQILLDGIARNALTAFRTLCALRAITTWAVAFATAFAAQAFIARLGVAGIVIADFVAALVAVFSARLLARHTLLAWLAFGPAAFGASFCASFGGAFTAFTVSAIGTCFGWRTFAAVARAATAAITATALGTLATV